MRSWWRREQVCIAAAVAATVHRSAEPATCKAPGGPKTATDGVKDRQGRLGAPACPCGGVPPPVPVVMVQEAAHDDATIAFLLSQTLLAEREAKEAKEVEETVADLARKEPTLLEELERHRVSFLYGLVCRSRCCLAVCGAVTASTDPEAAALVTGA